MVGGDGVRRNTGGDAMRCDMMAEAIIVLCTTLLCAQVVTRILLGELGRQSGHL